MFASMNIELDLPFTPSTLKMVVDFRIPFRPKSLPKQLQKWTTLALMGVADIGLSATVWVVTTMIKTERSIFDSPCLITWKNVKHFTSASTGSNMMKHGIACSVDPLKFQEVVGLRHPNVLSLQPTYFTHQLQYFPAPKKTMQLCTYHCYIALVRMWSDIFLSAQLFLYLWVTITLSMSITRRTIAE